jgi:hypothetical protein
MFTINKPKFNHLLIIAASLIAQNTQANGDSKLFTDSIYDITNSIDVYTATQD